MMFCASKFLVFAGLVAASAAKSESAVRGGVSQQQEVQHPHHRSLEDLDLCIMCDLCEALSPECDENEIASFACDLCDEDGGDGDGDSPDVCFSGVATVQVLQPNQQQPVEVPMKDLKVGDQILTGATMGKAQYEIVYAFGHHNPNKMAKFYQIYNEESKNPLELTADHMVFLQNKKAPVAASTLRVGDVLTGSTGPSEITKISTVQRKGVYAPLVGQGKLLVDGVMASSYIRLGSDNSHALIHMSLSPYRMVCSGISSRFCGINTYNSDGMPHYVRAGLDVLHWVYDSSNDNTIVQAIALSFVATLTGSLFAWELVFGASLAPLMAFLAVLAYSSYYQKNKKKNEKKVL